VTKRERIWAMRPI